MELNDYIQGSKQLCVSVSLGDAIWLKKSHYSPSRLLRKAIHNLKNNKSSDDLKEMIMKVESLTRLVSQQAQFIENNKLADRFGHFQDKVDDEALKLPKDTKNVVVAKEDIEKEVEEVFGK